MSYHWSTHQLTEYLVGVSAHSNPSDVLKTALMRATETLDAELGVVVLGDAVRDSVGFGRLGVPESFIANRLQNDVVMIDGIGAVEIVHGSLAKTHGQQFDGRQFNGRQSGGQQFDGQQFDGRQFDGRQFDGRQSGGRLIIGRMGEAFTAEEQQLLQGMALVLGLVLRNLETLRAERTRHQLVETLLAIQRAISARRPLTELLDAITAGASSLVGGCPIALLLADPLTPGALLPASSFDFPDLDQDTLAVVQQIMATDVAGPKQTDGGPKQTDGGPKQTDGGPKQADGGPKTWKDRNIVAEPVVVAGEIAGCLIARVSDLDLDRGDQGTLLTAFAQQVSLALTDARTLEAVREAHHDSITGLPNRPLFLKRLSEARRLTLALGRELTVLFIDLDRFKSVNDTLGHQAGDDLLAEVGQRILDCIRPEDTAARLGGDEFAVLLDGIGTDAGQAVAERIIAALAEVFWVADRNVYIGASVGIAALTSAQDDAQTLLSDADVAMYRAKSSGRGRFVVFEPEMHEEVANRLSLRTDLQRAQSGGQLWLAYQPIIELGTLAIDGVEALMRWTHPGRGPIQPSEFIPIAEETETIVALGTWAAFQSLAEVEAWRNITPRLSLSLNISARQVADPGLSEMISSALALTGFAAHSLTLEITESLLMDDPQLARTRLEALKELGVQLAIDDFGTGYSSLSYLRQFPVDQVKIDRSFVTGLAIGANDDIAVVRSVIQLCQSLRLTTVAEGIETSEQLEILRDLGCDLGQGYYFSRPMEPQHWHEYAQGAGDVSLNAAERK